MKSECCNAACMVEGNITKYFVCSECRKPCDLEDEKKTCKWKWDDKEEGVIATECDEMFCLEVEMPTINDFKVCPYCGKPILDKCT